MTEIIVIGAGGHARVVIAELRAGGHRFAGVVDADPARHGQVLDDVPILGGDAVIDARAPADVILANAIGNRGAKIGDSALGRRRAVFEKFAARGYRFASVISTSAVIAKAAQLGPGCHVMAGAIIQPAAVIGANTIVNTGAQVDHDCVIGAHCHITPGAVLCGAVTLGDEVHVGAGAVIVLGVKIGSHAMVGAGAVREVSVALQRRPNDASLLNSRCWVKGTRNQSLDTALKDCTKAIELADSPAAPLDSRAMVYYRMGRMEDALADLDAALDEAPDMAAALYMRAVVKRTERGKSSSNIRNSRIRRGWMSAV